MTEGFQKSIYLSGTNHDLLIEALAPVGGPLRDQFRRVAFRSSDVRRIEEISQNVSAIALKDGVTIPIAMAFDRLKEAVYTPDIKTGTKIDFTLVTGPAVVCDDIAPLAKATGDEKTEKKKTVTTQAPLRIKAILRRPKSNEFSLFTFSESDVAKFEVDTGTRSKTTQSISVTFNNSVQNVPFKSVANHLHLDMPYEDFVRELVAARKRNTDVLDLVALFDANHKKYGFNPD